MTSLRLMSENVTARGALVISPWAERNRTPGRWQRPAAPVASDAMTRTPPLVLATIALVTAYAVGGVIAVLTDIADATDVFTNGTKTSAPFFMLVIEPLAAYAFLRGKRAGAAVLAALTGLSTVAFAFDGDFNDDALGAGHVAWQLLEGWLALAVFSLAVTALIRTRRRPAAAAGA